MFTGLIEAVGRVAAVAPMKGGVRLAVETALAPCLAVGDSVAHNGVCLTLVDVADRVITTEVSPETLRVTNLGALAVGSLVNLERPVRADGLMGGHFVQGHVDGTGSVRGIVNEGDFWRFTFTYPEPLAPLLVPKGSIAVDGISLTVAALRPGEFDVQIVPHTWTHTNLRARRVGELVNLECDMIGKYVLRIVEAAGWTRTAPLAGGAGGPTGGR